MTNFTGIFCCFEFCSLSQANITTITVFYNVLPRIYVWVSTPYLSYVYNIMISTANMLI